MKAKRNELLQSFVPSNIKVYTTTDFSKFKPLKFNRGRDNGIEPKRLAEFHRIYEKGEYFHDIIHVCVNLNFDVVDGLHHLTLHNDLKKKGIIVPLNFAVLPQKEFNEGTPAQKLAAVARYNAKTSKWDATAHFETAIKCKEKLALEIARVKAVYEAKYPFKKNLLTPSRIYAMITEDKKGLSSQSKTVEDYCKSELVKVMSADKFKNEFDFACAVMAKVVAHNKVYEDVAFINPFFVVRNVMPLIWDNELNMRKFYHNLNKRGFMGVSNTMSGIRTFVDEVAKMKPRKDEVLMSWV